MGVNLPRILQFRGNNPISTTAVADSAGVPPEGRSPLRPDRCYPVWSYCSFPEEVRRSGSHRRGFCSLHGPGSADKSTAAPRGANLAPVLEVTPLRLRAVKQLPKPPAGPTAPQPSAWPSLGAHWVLGIEPGLSGGAAGAAGLKVVTPASVSSPASWMSADYLASEILPPPFVQDLVSSVTQPALQAADSPFHPPPAHSHVGGVTGGGRRQSSPGWSAEVLTGRSGRAGEAACSVGLRSCGSPRTLRCRITHSVGVSGGVGLGGR